MRSHAPAARVVTIRAPPRRNCGRYRQSLVVDRLHAIPAFYCSPTKGGDDPAHFDRGPGSWHAAGQR